MNESMSMMLVRFHHLSSTGCCWWWFFHLIFCLFSSFFSSSPVTLSLFLSLVLRCCYFCLEEVLALPLAVLVSVAYALLCTLKPNIFGTYVDVGGDGRR